MARPFSLAIALLGCGRGRALLPPGYEDELYCPKGYCTHRRATDEDFVGPKSAFWDCMRVSAFRDEDWDSETKAVFPWGSKMPQSRKDELISKGFSTDKCEDLQADEGGDNVSTTTTLQETEDKPAPPPASTQAPQELYDCDAGFENWQELWSPEKMEGCCHLTGRGCKSTKHTAPTTVPEVTTTSASTSTENALDLEDLKDLLAASRSASTTTEKAIDLEDLKDLVAASMSAITTTEKAIQHVLEEDSTTTTSSASSAPEADSKAFDCKAGYSNWVKGWSNDKKRWCCEKEDTSCYDCDAGYLNWAKGWSDGQIAWCCEKEDRACFDCNAGIENWQKGWSKMKKAWCCKKEGKACPYDCDAGASNWLKGWSQAKKTWCCSRHKDSKYCKKPAATAETPPPAPGPAPPTTSAPPSTRKTTTMMPTTTTLPATTSATTSSKLSTSRTYGLDDCDEKCFYEGQYATCKDRVAWAQNHRFRGLPDACESSHKMVLEQCPVCGKCSLEGAGCHIAGNQTNAGTCDKQCSYKGQVHTCKARVQYAANHPPYAGTRTACTAAHVLVRLQCQTCFYCKLPDADCVAEEKKSPTVHPPAEDKGQTAPFDCVAGFFDWKNAWSNEKKAWCCKHESKGCDGIFDCKAGTSNWRLGWSAKKKDYCCKKVKLGCVEERQLKPAPQEAAPSSSQSLFHDNGYSFQSDRFVKEGLTASDTTARQPHHEGAGLTSRWGSFFAAATTSGLLLSLALLAAGARSAWRFVRSPGDARLGASFRGHETPRDAHSSRYTTLRNQDLACAVTDVEAEE